MLLFSLPAFVALCYYYGKFVRHMDQREDIIVFEDPLHKRYPARDLSEVTAVLLMYSAVHMLAIALMGDAHLESILWKHAQVFALRAFCLYVTPLGQPVGGIALRDPLSDWLSGNKGFPLINDCMYSGHGSHQGYEL